MKKYLGYPALALFLALAFLTLVLIQPPTIGQQPRPVTATAQHFPGRVVEVNRANLHSFHHPVNVAPRIFPPAHPRGVWRWHRTFGFILVPSANAPVETLLPENYPLPATVTQYQSPAECSLVCPHCGQQITIGLK